MRDLLNTKNDWLWTKEHQNSFKEVKAILSSPTVLTHYDPKNKTRIRTDDKKLNGISVVLYQKEDEKFKRVAYASTYLS